jgi:hypothetical protein
LGVAPMKIHKNEGVRGGSLCLKFSYAKTQKRAYPFWQGRPMEDARITKFVIGRFISQHIQAIDKFFRNHRWSKPPRQQSHVRCHRR